MRGLLLMAFGLALLMFAEADSVGDTTDLVLAQDTAPWGNVTNLTALGIVAVVMIFIVTKMLPDLHRKFVEQSEVFAGAIEKIQTAFTSILDRMHERDQIREKGRHDDQAALAAALMALSAQCARRHAGEDPVDHHA